MSPTRLLAPLLLLALPHVPDAAAGQEAAGRTELHRVRGERVAVYNPVGRVTLRTIEGAAVEVEATRQGPDAGQLRFETGPHGGRETLRVVFPEDRILYRPEGTSGKSTSQMHVRENGTFHDDVGPRGRRRLEIRNHGEGFEGHADLAVGLPRGQRFELFLGSGHVSVTNVEGDLRVDTGSANIVAAEVSGKILLDTGAGAVSVTGARGEVNVDTGSGAVTARSVEGAKLSIDTGSGGVVVHDVKVEELDVDTGSGAIQVDGAETTKLRLDTGSGSVTASLLRPFHEAVIDTGSGNISLELHPEQGASFELDTGSGNLQVDLPHEITRKGRRERAGTLGDGAGRLRVDTGSGNIKLGKKA